MLRRQGLPPSCPIRRNGSCPWNFRFPSCPAHRADGIHRHWAVAFYAAATSQWKASKTETISPSLEYRSSSGITIHAEVRGRSKGRFQKGRAPGEPSSRTGRGHHSSPPAGKGIRAPRRRRRIVFYTAGGGNSATRRILAVSSSSWKCGLRKITHLYAPGFPGSSLTSTRASRSG